MFVVTVSLDLLNTNVTTRLNTAVLQTQKDRMNTFLKLMKSFQIFFKSLYWLYLLLFCLVTFLI